MMLIITALTDTVLHGHSLDFRKLFFFFFLQFYDNYFGPEKGMPKLWSFVTLKNCSNPVMGWVCCCRPCGEVGGWVCCCRSGDEEGVLLQVW